MCKLIELKQGQKGIIAGVDTGDERILRKLMSMGILPGISVKMVQTFPSYVFQADYTQIAVDKTLASAILVNV